MFAETKADELSLFGNKLCEGIGAQNYLGWTPQESACSYLNTTDNNKNQKLLIYISQLKIETRGIYNKREEEHELGAGQRQKVASRKKESESNYMVKSSSGKHLSTTWHTLHE